MLFSDLISDFDTVTTSETKHKEYGEASSS